MKVEDVFAAVTRDKAEVFRNRTPHRVGVCASPVGRGTTPA
jgi:hypothetical protein